MARRRREAFSLPQLAKLTVLVLMAAGAAWLSVRTNLPRAVPQAGWISPGDPKLLFRKAAQELIEQKGTLTEERYDELAAAARRDPIAADPFMYFGMRALAANDMAGGERLLVEARHRNPRNRLSRLALMSLYLRTGRIREGGIELAAFARLVPGSGRVLVPELTRLAGDPTAREAVVAAVGDQPVMEDVLTGLVRSGAEPDLVLRLAARQPRRADGTFAPWQGLLLTRLVDNGEVGRAAALWSRFVGAERRGLVYDPEFRGQPGPPPFNWDLAASDVGAAERARGGGLDVEYFGRRAGPLARQLLVLRPGRYRMQFPAEGSGAAQGSRIVLQVTCRGGGAPLLNAPLQGLALTPRTIAHEFTVPAGCDAQWLSFAGQPGEFPNTQRARIGVIALQPVGGGA